MARINCTKRVPKDLKNADVTPIFKKDNPVLAKKKKRKKKKKRPVSVLPTVSKIFERIMQKQIIDYINQYNSPLLCGYRKGFSIQTVLHYFIDKWKFIF